MNRRRLIAACVAPALFLPVTACSHAPVAREMTGPHETLRISARAGETSAYAAGPALRAALEGWLQRRGGLPASLRELDAASLPGYTLTTACEDGSTGTQTLVDYHRPAPGNCVLQIRGYTRDGGMISFAEHRCTRGKWSGGGATSYNVSPQRR